MTLTGTRENGLTMRSSTDKPRHPATIVRFVLLATTMTLTLTACSASRPPVATPTRVVPAETVASQVVDTQAVRPPAPAWPKVKLTPIVSGLSQPVYVTSAGDGTSRLFIVEKTGTIRVVKNGTLLPKPFLDVSSLVSGGSEQGLLGLAFPPGFAQSGRFYIDYTDVSGTTVVARYHAAPGADVADGTAPRRILTIAHPGFGNHNGGCLQFGPDGYLYQGMGDGGSGGDPPGNAQNPGRLLGKMLRIDPEGAVKAGSAKPYLIPPTNPFARRARYRPEIWLLGMRNPWRYSFDRLTGQLWIGDVGQDLWEEIDLLPRGAGGSNMGWNLWEGNHPYPPGSTPSRAGFTFPIGEYGHPYGEALIGGYRYRGPTLAWNGLYFFGDEVKQWLGAMRQLPTGQWQRVKLLDLGWPVSSFGQDAAGNIYACDLANGRVYRLDKQ